LELPQYKDWYNSASTTLYVIGNPGVGKTVLAKFLVEELEKHDKSRERIIYFFCKRDGNGKHTSALSILRSLIHQCAGLVNSLWDKHIQSKYEKYGSDYDGLCEIFAAIMSDPEWDARVWYCVIDAFDQCEEDQRRHLLESMSQLEATDSSTTRSKRLRRNFRLLITSRPCESIRSKLSALRDTTTVSFADATGKSRNKHDIDRYIEEKVSENSSLKGPEGDIKNALKTGHEGMFKWASCMIESLGKTKRGKIDHTLKETPPQIYDMIRGMVVEGLQCADESANSLLEWVTLAFRDLTVQEVSVALKLTNQTCSSHSRYAPDIEGLQTIIESCGGLFRLEDDKVVLLHQSVKEFLLSEHFKDRLPVLHAKAAKACIVYLSCQELERKPLPGRRKSDCREVYEQLCEDFPFLEYAATSWHRHVGKAAHNDTSLNDLWFFFRDRFSNKPNMPLSLQINQFSKRQEYVGGQTCLHVLVHHNLDSFTRQLLNAKGTNPDAGDDLGRTPLWWAAKKNYVSMVRLLLQAAPYLDRNSKEKEREQSALSIAVEEGHIEVVRLLLRDKWVQHDAPDYQGRSPLSLAAGAGHGDIVKLLLEHKTFRDLVNSEDSFSNQTPLQWAARKGHASVVETLLGEGALPDAPSERGRTPLIWAAINGHEEVVRILLKRNEVDLFRRDEDESSAFECAASSKEDAIAREILDHACKRLQSQRSWEQAYAEKLLIPAATSNKEAAMELLLERSDINPDSQTENSKTALCEAAQNGHDAIVWQLLDSGRVDVNLPDHIEGRTPLHWAARHGRKKVVELLLETDGVDLRVGDSSGRTAETLARSAGYSEIANLIHKKAE